MKVRIQIIFLQAPTKSKYAAKMDYINKKNEIDTAKTNMYKSLSRLSKNGYVYELWNESSVFTLTQNENYVLRLE